MERHIKQQHPECWSSRGRGGGGRKSLAATSITTSAGVGSFSSFNLVPHDLSNQFVQARGGPVATKGEIQLPVEGAEEYGTDIDERDEDGMLIIDDKAEILALPRNKRKLELEEEEEDPAASDLASVKKLLNTATIQNFQHYFPNRPAATAREEMAVECSANNATSEDEEEMGQEQSGDEAKKSSAYSAAPHKIDCPFCPRQFPWTSSLNRHILTHTGQKPYKCQDCQLWFTTKSNRDRHQVRKHGGVLDTTHISRNVSDRPFKCNKCPVSTFATEDNLIRHHYEKHPNLEYPAGDGSKCLDEFNVLHGGSLAPEEDDDDEDEAKGVVEVTSYFKCHLCAEDFLHRAQTIAHVEDEHPETYRDNIGLYEAASRIPIDFLSVGPKRDSKEEPDVIRVNCIFCPCQFKSPVELAKHVLGHTRVKQYICDLCREELPSRLELSRHKRKHDNNVVAVTTSKESNSTREELMKEETIDKPLHNSICTKAQEALATTPTGSVENLVAKSLTTTIIGAGNPVAKRANLMDKINRLSLLSAAKASGQSSGLNSLLFSQQQQPVVAD